MPYPRLTRNFPLLGVFLAMSLWGAGRAWAENAPPAQSSKVPQVVVSIAPIHSLASAIMRDVGEPELLLRATTSPHAFSLRPSDARKLSQADVIFWVGPGLETTLNDSITSLALKGRVVTLSQAKNMRILLTREGGLWMPLAPTARITKPLAPEHRYDMHVWLSVDNAKIISRRIANVLSHIDSAHKEKYQANLQHLLVGLDELDGRLRATLRPVRNSPYLVFHDAYQYFEEKYELSSRGAITVSPNHQPGARRLQYLRQYVREADVACVFAEPQFAPALIDVVVKNSGARIGVLDPLGVTIKPGRKAYMILMENLARDLSDCLSGGAIADRN